MTTGDEIVIEVEFAIAERIEAVFFCRAGQYWHAQGRKRASRCAARDTRPCLLGLTKFPRFPEIAITNVRRCWPATGISARRFCRGAKPAGRVPDVSRPTMRCALQTLLTGWRIWRSQSRQSLRGQLLYDNPRGTAPLRLPKGHVGGQARSSRIMPTTVTKSRILPGMVTCPAQIFCSPPRRLACLQLPSPESIVLPEFHRPG